MSSKKKSVNFIFHLETETTINTETKEFHRLDLNLKRLLVNPKAAVTSRGIIFLIITESLKPRQKSQV